ncbi:MAG TPA: SusC/RagA family TonB-linked outer membrane protein [Gemmatimonadaceae bacterium]
MRSILRFGPTSAFAIVAAVSTPAALMAQATVTGRVTAAGTNQPISDVRVYAVGTTAVASTNADGRYTLHVKPGTMDVRATRIGFIEQKKSVTATAGAPATLDFSLEQSSVKLTEIVTTATGEQRKVELGNSVTTLGNIAEKVETTPVNNLADLMVAKAPGVQVLAGNMTGSAPVIRIRGIKSISLSSDPIYVIDGVRMSSGALSLNTGGTAASFLNTLNPEEVADIEIVKGPSAATLYGTDAANGVIVITTKRGVAGAPRWTVHAEGGLVKDRNDYPSQYALWGHRPATPATPRRCLLADLAATPATCVVDSLTSYNLLADKQFSPITTGYTKGVGAQVSGGTDAVRYFVSGDFEGEQGTLTLPQFSQDYLSSTGTNIREEWLHPEYFNRLSLRSNLNAAISPKLDMGVSIGYGKTAQRLPPVDNNTESFLFQAFGNPGFKPTAACATAPSSCLGYTNTGLLGEELGGYAQYTPASTFQRLNQLKIDRLTTSGDAHWRPFSWMQNDATVGMDLANRDRVALCRFNECAVGGGDRIEDSFVRDTRSVDRNLSAQVTSNATWQALTTLNLKTTLGAQYTNQQSEFTDAEGDQLPPGAQSPGQAAIAFVDGSFIRADKTLGYYLQEQATIRDLLFITAAARTDQNSAFGTKFQRVFYPKLGVSYIISDESFFPKFSWLDQLRLRGAYGASGVQPGSTTALRTFAATTVSIGTDASDATDTPALLASALGNPNLKPERSTEREVGFESRLFNSRFNIDFTYYNNVTKDALISQPIAPSAGPSALSVTRNLGSIANSGIEATITSTLVDRRDFGWDLTVGGSHNTNIIKSLGYNEQGEPNPTIGTGSYRDSLGLPINGVFARPYTYSDANGDGIIVASEITVDKNFQFLGYSSPRDLVTIQNGFNFFNRKLQVNTLLDYRGGFSIFNNYTGFLCRAKFTCYDEQNPKAPLAAQARVVAYRTLGSDYGYWETGQFWRLREVSATYTVPTFLANQLRARDASLTLSARNLHVWSSFTGPDPETNYGTGDIVSNLLTTAPPSYFTLRLNLHF